MTSAIGDKYTPGECTWGAAALASWIPGGLGNADTWVTNAHSLGLNVGQSPVVGSAMVFNGGYPGSGGYGHVGIVQEIGVNGYPIIKEMNAGRNGGGFGIYDTYQTTSRDFAYLAGFIYPPGSSGAANGVTSAGLMSYYPSGAPTTGLNPNAGTSPTAGTIDLNPVDAIGGAIGGAVNVLVGFFMKSGEILIGVALVGVGFFIIIKQANVPGVTQVTNLMGKIPGVTGTVAKVASVASSAGDSSASGTASLSKAKVGSPSKGPRLTPAESRAAVAKFL